jgi:1-deoxy-D-xylulose-5-phosphate reductoisomerase
MRQELRLGIAVLGSTGSVGRQTLSVIDDHPDRFRVVALAARSPSDLFCSQIARYAPEVTAVAEPTSHLPFELQPCFHGVAGLTAAATHPNVDLVVVATSGHDAIAPTMDALRAGKTVALANKETLVCAGALIMPLAAACGTTVRPVDSEHSAIWQVLGNAPPSAVQRIILTASGGPFRTTSQDDLARVTAQQALSHPTWSMGGKITIDSATLMNKGLEIIEAHWLFDISYPQIDVIVHPESVIHSLVEFVDGSQIAQLGLPDMRLPIQYALAFPERLPRIGDRLDLLEATALHFEPPDIERFPCLRIAREAGVAGGTYPTVLSAADDEAVTAFLANSIRFVDIPAVVADVLDQHQPAGLLSLEAILEADSWARATARKSIARKRLAA